MFDVRYDFCAVCHPPYGVALYVTTEGVPFDLTTEEIDAVWQDILQCFIQGGFPRVVEVLNTLSYDWCPAGVFLIQGLMPQRRKIFHLLARYQDISYYRKNACLSASVEFLRSQQSPHLSIHFHNGAVHSWTVDDIGPPPKLEGQRAEIPPV